MLFVCLSLAIVACGETATTTQNGAVTSTPAVTTVPETIPVTVAPTVTTPAPATTATANEASPLDAILENKTKLTFGDDGEFRVMCLQSRRRKQVLLSYMRSCIVCNLHLHILSFLFRYSECEGI